MAADRWFMKPGADRAELEKAWRDRVREAEILRKAGRYATAIVTGIYSVEILLKVKICKKLDLARLPRAFEIHDLDSLLLLAGLSGKIDRPRWSGVRDSWVLLVKTSESLNEMRYSSHARWSEADAAGFFACLTGTPQGVLPWLRGQR
jgi:hypothetical protein